MAINLLYRNHTALRPALE